MKNWMGACGNLDSSLFDDRPVRLVPLNRLYLLGSHDSGTYKINGTRLAENCQPGVRTMFKIQDLAIVLNLAYFPTIPWCILVKEIALSSIARWAICQEHRIFAQLEGGVRFLDLRIGLRHEEPYLVHSLYCVPLKTVFRDIRRFIDENKTEVVIIDVQHCYSEERLAPKFVEMFQKYFKNECFILQKEEGGRKARRKMRKKREKKKFRIPCLQECWDAGQRIIFTLQPKLHSLIRKPGKMGIFNRNDLVRSAWPQRSSTRKSIDFIDREQRTQFDATVRKRNSFHVSQCIVTPNAKQVMDPFSSMLSLGGKCSRTFTSEIRNVWGRERTDFSIVLLDHCLKEPNFTRYLVRKNVKDHGENLFLLGEENDIDQIVEEEEEEEMTGSTSKKFIDETETETTDVERAIEQTTSSSDDDDEEEEINVEEEGEIDDDSDDDNKYDDDNINEEEENGDDSSSSSSSSSSDEE